MDPVIWIEILSRHREVVARHRFGLAEVRVGRGYANDLILDDPYVAVDHLRLYRNADGQIVGEDIGSANGTFVLGDPRRQNRFVVYGDWVIRIGNTLLRVRESGHEVPRERVLEPQRRRWPVVAALAVAILGIEALSLWVGDIGQSKASYYVNPLLAVAGIAAVWTSLWAVLSRIFAGHAQFERQLLIALSGILAYSLYSEFAQFAAFSLAWRTPSAYEYAALWGVLGLVCFGHSRAIGPSRSAIKAAAVAALTVTAVVAQTLMQSEALADRGQQSYLRRLLPPMLRLAPVQDENTFFAEVEQLRMKLDADRAQSPAEDAIR